MGKKYILGGGISGLIFGFYNPQYQIISPEIGGKLSKSFMKNTVYLHESQDSIDFLNDLGIKFVKRTHTIQYVKNKIVKHDIYMTDKIAFIKKKLDNKDFEPVDVNLSTDDYYMSVLQIDWDEIINKLKEKVKVIDDKVIRITDTEIICEKTKYEYNEIVSTLPANIFWELYYQTKDIELKSKSITFVLGNEIPNVLVGINFDLVYFIDDKFRYSRINKYNNYFLYEFTGEISKENVVKYLPKNCNIKEYFVEKNGIIFTNPDNIPPKNIRFLGRFSSWNHKIKINDVIKESKYSYDFRHIFNRQKDFFNKVEGLSSVQTIEQKEKKTHMFLLHLLSELTEVLEVTNYKTHKLHKDVDTSKIKEELTDSFKYLLSMFLVWDVDMQELVELFNNKSSIVEKKFDGIKNAKKEYKQTEEHEINDFREKIK